MERKVVAHLRTLRPRRIKITRKIREPALGYVEIVESTMDKREIKLRDGINKELAREGFHLRVAMLTIPRKVLKWATTLRSTLRL